MTGIVAVVVAYRPDAVLLEQLLRALAPQVDGGIVVNNGTDLPIDAPLLAQWGFVVVHLGANLGVAAALNAGFQWAERQQADAVISFDQDSEPAPDMVRRLQDARRALAGTGAAVAALGPQQIDRRTGRAAPFIAPIHWRRRKLFPREGDVVEVDHVITSGCLTPLSAWRATGGFLDALFIDYVDIEWCLRARARGLKLYAVGGATLRHAIGDGIHHWRGREVSSHGPQRHYYLMRNGIYLQKLGYIARGWRLSDAIQLLKKFVFFAVAGRPRAAHIRAMLRGLRDGCAGSLDAAPSRRP